MDTRKRPLTAESRQPLLFWLLRLLSHSLWTPEPDEKRFLAGLPIAMFLVPLLWKIGIHPLGAYLGPAIFFLWCLVYVIKFGRRLKKRGELKRVIFAPAVFVALVLSVSFY
jgi:hypothetical protein